MAKMDEELMQRLRNVANMKHDELRRTAPKPEAEVTPTTTVGFTSTSKSKPFSEVFGFAPLDMPDFPVEVFEPEDWDVSIRSRIPAADPKYVFNNKTLSQFMFALYCNAPTMLYGPTGTGKTSLAREVSARTNRPFLRVGCHGKMESTEFLGTTQIVNDEGVPITKHNHTDTTLAATYGGMLCIDEAFRSPILMAVQPLLEQPPTLTIQDCQAMNSTMAPPENRFWIVLTDNTNGTGDNGGRYITEAQDLSTLARINTAIYIDYMAPREEMKLLQTAFPNINDVDAMNMCNIAKLIRDAFVGNTLMQVMDIRALLAWGRNYSLLSNLDRALSLAFFSRLNKDDKVIVNNIFRQVLGRDIKE